MRNPLPTGTVTFLFTDLEGSTRLLQELGHEAYKRRWERVAALIRAAVEEQDGLVVNSEGDAFFAVFRTGLAALMAVVDFQRRLFGLEDTELRVRAGIHTGEGRLGGDDYVGLDVHRTARIAAAAHGGQVLVSESTRSLVEQSLPSDVVLRDLGNHRLKDLARAEHIYQLVIHGIPHDFPPPRSLDVTPHNLPVQLTTFVGRRRELAEAAQILAEARLLTVTGTGGSGKTRLILQLAAEVADRFQDGVFFASLAEASEAEEVPPLIARALGLPLVGERPALEAVRDAIGEQSMLLVLDNLEQVASATSIVAALLWDCPNLTIAATSRVPLYLTGEHQYPLAPLQTPGEEAAPAEEQLLRSEAGMLFLERARSVKPDLALTASSAMAIAEIVRRLDGLPLAIELAAAKVRLLPPESILARLTGSLDLLQGGQRDLPLRQQTLRKAIAWSHDLLDEDQSRLFRRLSVFVGSGAMTEIEAVCRLEPACDVLDGLSALVDQSLVRQIAQEGEPRFQMLNTIREFAEEKLEESGEADVVRDRHASAFHTLAERAARELEGPRQIEWLNRLETEHGNLRAALERHLECSRPGQAVRMSASLWRFWFLHRHYQEGRRLLARTLETADDRHPDGQAEALIGAAALGVFDGDRRAAETLITRARRLIEAMDRPDLTATAAWVQGVVALEESPGRAEELFSESLHLAVQGSASRAEVWARYWMGNLARRRGQHEEAAQHFRQCLEGLRSVGDPLATAWCMEQLGDLATYRGDPAAATALYEESLDVFRQAADKDGMARALNGLGTVARVRGDFRQAMQLHEEALALRRGLGIKRSIMFTLLPLGIASRLAGEWERSASALEEARRMAVEAEDPWAMASILEALGALAIDRAEPERAARLLGAAEGLRDHHDIPYRTGAREERDRDVARLDLTDDIRKEEWSAGRARADESLDRLLTL